MAAEYRLLRATTSIMLSLLNISRSSQASGLTSTHPATGHDRLDEPL
jgi:hypothetical protein